MARAPLLQLSDISLTYGGNPVFDKLGLSVQQGDRVALAMRNLPEWPMIFFAITSIGAIAGLSAIKDQDDAELSAEKMVQELRDDNLRLLAQKGGVVGICQMRPFLTTKRQGALADYFRHIDHAVKVAGADHVAIGSDRDHRVIPDTPEELAILLQEEGSQISPQDWPLYLEKLNNRQH